MILPMHPSPQNLLEDWTPDSWKSRPAAQQPVYPDQERLNAVLCELASPGHRAGF